MTRDEAIAILRQEREGICTDIQCTMTTYRDFSGVDKCNQDCEEREAYDMAIEALQEQERDGCEGCRYIHKEPADEPCKRCRNNYLNLWEPEPKAKEFTADDLIGAFRDTFVERRAIGILDIENKVKELFE